MVAITTSRRGLNKMLGQTWRLAMPKRSAGKPRLLLLCIGALCVIGVIGLVIALVAARSDDAATTTGGVHLGLADTSFDTAYGTGHFHYSRERGQVCLTIPDVTGTGSSCTSATAFAKNGLHVELLSPSASANPSQLVIALPYAATAPIVKTNDGQTRTLHVADGIATGLFTEDATVSYRVHNRTINIDMVGHETDRAWYVGCGPNRPAVRVSKQQALNGDSAELCR